MLHTFLPGHFFSLPLFRALTFQEPLDGGRHRRLQRRQLEAHRPGDAEVRETQLEEHRKRRCAGDVMALNWGAFFWGELVQAK